MLNTMTTLKQWWKGKKVYMVSRKVTALMNSNVEAFCWIYREENQVGIYKAPGYMCIVQYMVPLTSIWSIPPYFAFTALCFTADHIRLKLRDAIFYEATDIDGNYASSFPEPQGSPVFPLSSATCEQFVRNSLMDIKLLPSPAPGCFTVGKSSFSFV